MAVAICIRRCWDGHKTRRYYPGDTDDIDPEGEMAENFTFPDAKVEPKAEFPKVEAATEVPIEDKPRKKLTIGALKAMEVAKKRKEREGK